MNIGHVRIFANLGRDFAGQCADFLDVFTGDAELHWITNRRAVLQTSDPRAQGRELFVESRDQPGAQAFTLFDGFRQHDKLGEARRR
ncbi:hypothetical protein D3C87_1424050 [compost metagenome]